MPASLSELVLGWETHFELVRFLNHPDHYRRTFRAWGLAYRAQLERARTLVGDATARTFSRYFAAGEVFFRLREDSLYRVILKKRPQPKTWVRLLRPSDMEETAAAGDRVTGASPAAVQSHYDVSNTFYALWLGPTLMYSSGLWSSGADDANDLDAAVLRKIDFFARHVVRHANDEVLDVGCGWGGTLRRLSEAHRTGRSVGLTLSAAQRNFIGTRPIPNTDIRLESWADHEPVRPYDAIFSFGAFEHFARDGTTSIERIRTYRQFFGRCFEWLKPDGRLALETITHDAAPDTQSPLGRGPLGDFVLEIYPESICPHLSVSSRTSRWTCSAPTPRTSRERRACGIWRCARTRPKPSNSSAPRPCGGFGGISYLRKCNFELTPSPIRASFSTAARCFAGSDGHER